MPFAYYSRLSRPQQAVYRRSDGLHSVPLPRAEALAPLASELSQALADEDRRRAQAVCQRLSDGITDQLGSPRCQVRVHAVRPADDRGELHGLYQPIEDGRPARIGLWMRTAQRQQVVAFRTFLRTLLHELCHHLDYELFGLEATFHTEGFYKRESSLFRQLVPDGSPTSPRRR